MAGGRYYVRGIFLHSEKNYLRPLFQKHYVMKERKLMIVVRISVLCHLANR